MKIPHLKALACAFAAAVALTGCGTTDPVTQAGKAGPGAGQALPGIEEIRAIAEEGFVYGFPLVENYAVMHDFVLDRNSPQWKAPFNGLHHEHRVFTYQDTMIVTPNSDTPYSMSWLDLRAEPVVISVPAVSSPRYYSVMLNDGNTHNYGYIGSRTTGTEAGSYLVAGPRWKGPTPSGIKKVFQSGTDFSLVIFRTQMFDAGDMDNVVKVQSGYKVQPLSAFLKQPAPQAPAAIVWPKIDKDLARTRFFEYLDFVPQFAPPGPEEEGIRARLARIGVGPGRKFAFEDLPADHKAAALLAMQEGEKRVERKVDSIGTSTNGWRVAAAFGDRSFYKGDWLLRAAAA
jgi:hypothetical protein